ncbi:hypothetical protein OAF54_00295, partial [bacterium]|nr:hypothetical protein [bacterium]
AELCEVIPAGIHYEANEVFSMHVGEIEDQLEEDLTTYLDSLEEEDFESVCNEAGVFYKHGCIYEDASYHRWVLVVDTDQL